MVVVHGITGHAVVDFGELVAAVAERVASNVRVVEQVLDHDFGAARGSCTRTDLAVEAALFVAGRVGAGRAGGAREDAEARDVRYGGFQRHRPNKIMQIVNTKGRRRLILVAQLVLLLFTGW